MILLEGINLSPYELGGLVVAILTFVVLLGGAFKAIKDIRTIGWKPFKEKWSVIRKARKQRKDLIDLVTALQTTINTELSPSEGQASLKQMVGVIGEKVEHMEARNRHQDETSSIAIFELNATGGIRYVNARFRELVDADEQELMYRDYVARMHPDDKSRYLRDLDEAIANKMPLYSVVRMRVYTDQFKTIRFQARPDIRSSQSAAGQLLMGFFGTATETTDTVSALKNVFDGINQ